MLLCYLEGRTNAEAATELGWPKGTVQSRLAQARELLRSRLVRRGITLSPATLVSTIEQQAIAATLPAGLIQSTVSAAISLAMGQSAVPGALSTSAVTLMEGVMSAMYFNRLKYLAWLVLIVGLGAAGAGLLVRYHAPAEHPQPDSQAVSASPAPPSVPRAPLVDQFGDPLPQGAQLRLGAVRFQHEGVVTHGRFTPDGKTLLTVTTENTLRHWDMDTGTEQARVTLQVPDGERHESHFLPHAGHFLVSLGEGPQGCVLRTWDTRSGKSLHWQALTENFSCWHVSPDGSRMATGTRDGSVMVWITATGKELHQFTIEKACVRGMVIAPDNNSMTIAIRGNGDPDEVVFWDLRRMKEIRRVTRAPGTNREPAYSPDGTRLALPGEILQVLDAGTGKLLWQCSSREAGAAEIRHVAFSPDGKILAANQAGSVLMLDAATGKKLREVYGHARLDARPVVFSPDGQRLAVLGRNSFYVWESATGLALHADRRHQGGVKSVAFSPDGKVLATADWGTVRLWDPVTSKEIRQLEGDYFPNRCTVAFSPDGKVLAYAGGAPIRLWDAVTGKACSQFSFRRPAAAFMAQFLTHDSDRMPAPEQQAEPVDHAPAALAFTHDGKTIATTGRPCGDSTGITLWDVTSGKVMRKSKLPLRFGGDMCLVVAPDGKTAASTDVALRIWDLATGNMRTCLLETQTDGPNPSQPFFRSLAFAPDGRTLAVAYTESPAERLSLVDAQTGNLVCRLDGEKFVFGALTYSPDGKTLAAGSSNGEIILWEVATRQPRGWLRGHRGSVNALAFSPDGKTLASGSDDGTALVWPLFAMDGQDSPTGALAGPEIEKIWGALASDNPTTGYAAVARLLQQRAQAVSLFRDRLKLQTADARRLGLLIAGLDNPDFSRRHQATEALEAEGDLAIPALQQILAGNPSLELRSRVEALLVKLHCQTLIGGSLRSWRAIEVLEQIATPEARTVLQILAKGEPGARVTQAANAALERSMNRGRSGHR